MLERFFGKNRKPPTTAQKRELITQIDKLTTPEAIESHAAKLRASQTHPELITLATYIAGTEFHKRGRNTGSEADLRKAIEIYRGIKAKKAVEEAEHHLHELLGSGGGRQ